MAAKRAGAASPKTAQRRSGAGKAEAVPTGANRVVIEAVQPQVDGGRFAPKRVVGDVVDVSADIFVDGHDRIGAAVVFRPAGLGEWQRAAMSFLDNDRWTSAFTAERAGRYEFTIEAWRDPFATWLSEVEKKLAANQPVELELIEGAAIVRKARDEAAGSAAAAFDSLLAQLGHAGPADQWTILGSEGMRALMASSGLRLNLSTLASPLPLVVDRARARFSAWYELFPRSQTNDPKRHGTFDDVIARLPASATWASTCSISRRSTRSARRTARAATTLTPAPDDPGSPTRSARAKAGTTPSIRNSARSRTSAGWCARAKEHGLEIALDFAIQCSPDHPWLKEHPDWFDWRRTASIRMPRTRRRSTRTSSTSTSTPTRLPGLWLALRDVVLFWVERGREASSASTTRTPSRCRSGNG
jgi:starch synthase (maltosyl-transferring)